MEYLLMKVNVYTGCMHITVQPSVYSKNSVYSFWLCGLMSLKLCEDLLRGCECKVNPVKSLSRSL